MYKLSGITDEPYQAHTLLLDEGEAVLELRFLPAVQIWIMSVTHGEKVRTGIKLSASVYHLRSYGFEFDFVVTLTDGSGIDPFRVDDFASGRCEIYFVSPEEMQVVRGQEE